MKFSKHKFLNDLVNGSLTNVTSIILSFFRTMLFIRYVGVSDFGQLQYLFSLLAIPDLFSGNIDFVIKRYFGERVDIRSQILSANLLVKSLVFFIAAIVVTIYVIWRNIVPLNQAWLGIFILVLLRIFFGLFKNTLINSLQAVKQYSLLNYVEIGSNLLLLLTVLAFSKVADLRGTTLIFWVNLVWLGVIILGVLILMKEFKKQFNSIHLNYSLETLNTGLWDFRKYFMPLLGTSLSGYLKHYLPAVLLGESLLFKEVTYYETIRKIFGMVYKQIPTLFMVLIPSLREASLGKNFNQRWGKGMFFYFLSNFLFCTAMFFFGPYLLSFYNINFDQEILSLIMVFSFGLMLGSWVQANQMLVFVTNNTSIIFTSSIIRQVAFGIYLLFIIKKMNPVLLSIGVNGMHLPTIILFALSAYRNDNQSFYLQAKYFLWILVMLSLLLFIYKYLNPLVIG